MSKPHTADAALIRSEPVSKRLILVIENTFSYVETSNEFIKGAVSFLNTKHQYNEIQQEKVSVWVRKTDYETEIPSER